MLIDVRLAIKVHVSRSYYDHVVQQESGFWSQFVFFCFRITRDSYDMWAITNSNIYQKLLLFLKLKSTIIKRERGELFKNIF